MAGKMSPKFVVLSTLAVGAIYASGYAISSASNQAMAATTAGAATTQKHETSHHSKQPSSNHSNTTNSSSSSKPASTPSKPSVNTTSKYVNGTYSGAASNQIGEVQVSVTIESDKITNVQITGCYTHYPESYIDPALPQYVVAHQTTQGPIVSGATLSSEDFYGAVQQAVAKAHNPNYKG